MKVPLLKRLSRQMRGRWRAIVLALHGIAVSGLVDAKSRMIFAGVAHAVLAKTRRLYVESAPEQLGEQGATSEEFVAHAARFFKSAYVDGSMKFIRAADFSAHLLPLSRQRGLLLNLLFTQEVEPAGAPR